MPRRGNGVFTRPLRLDAVDAPARESDGVRSAQGFNKNVTAYVTKGREALAKVPGGDFTLVHHNAYKADELGECFERNAEVRRGVLPFHAITYARRRRAGGVLPRDPHAVDAVYTHTGHAQEHGHP